MTPSGDAATAGDPSDRAVLDRPASRDVLVLGLHGLVDLGFVRQYVSDEVGTVPAADLRDRTLTLITDLLVGGRFVAGQLEKTGFTPWPPAPMAALTRIRHEWDTPDAPLLPGDICWLQITEAGEALARRLRDGSPTSALEWVDPVTAATLRGVLGHRSPLLLRALLETDRLSMSIREQVEDVLADEFTGHGLRPDWEPTPYGVEVDDAIGRFLLSYPITRGTKGTDAWPPRPDLRGDR